MMRAVAAADSAAVIHLPPLHVTASCFERDAGCGALFTVLGYWLFWGSGKGFHLVATLFRSLFNFIGVGVGLF